MRVLAEASLALLRAEKAFLLNPQMSEQLLLLFRESPTATDLPASPTFALRPAPYQCQLSRLILFPESKKLSLLHLDYPSLRPSVS